MQFSGVSCIYAPEHRRDAPMLVFVIDLGHIGRTQKEAGGRTNGASVFSFRNASVRNLRVAG